MSLGALAGGEGASGGVHVGVAEDDLEGVVGRELVAVGGGEGASCGEGGEDEG